MTTGVLKTFDDTRLAFERWSGDDLPSLLLVHATGFCKEVWRPVMAELASLGIAAPGIAFDQRAHGDSGLPSPPFSWTALGRDVEMVADEIPAPRVGVGHSSGGAALCMAERARPGTFSSLVLIEPIVFPGPHRRVEELDFIERVRRRRPSFDSRAAALENFADKAPFDRWRRDALLAYIDHGFRPDGGRWVLKCTPESEAEFYREGLNHDTWKHLDAVRCPVLVLAGEDSTTHPRSFVDEVAGRFPDARAIVVEDATHLLAMERPDAVAAAIATAIDAAGPTPGTIRDR